MEGVLAGTPVAGCARLTCVSYAGDITPQQSWELLRTNPDAVLVDVRTGAEWTWVGVPDLSEVTAAGVTPGERPVVFLCRSGKRSIPAAEAATAAGIGPSYNMLEGFEGQLDERGHRGGTGWRAEGLPWKQT